jgi:hypothetical protein
MTKYFNYWRLYRLLSSDADMLTTEHFSTELKKDLRNDANDLPAGPGPPGPLGQIGQHWPGGTIGFSQGGRAQSMIAQTMRPLSQRQISQALGVGTVAPFG